MVSYTTVSPLPVPVWQARQAIGGLVLWHYSVGSPRLGVIQLPVLWSPDFPRPHAESLAAATVWQTRRSQRTSRRDPGKEGWNNDLGDGVASYMTSTEARSASLIAIRRNQEPAR